MGFDYAHHRTKQVSSNMKSAMEHATVVKEYLAKECAEGRVLGPFNMDQFPLRQISIFGVIPKGSTGKWRLILDLSSPEGFSVNDGISPEWCSMSYITVEDAAKIITRLRRHTQLTKVDIKSAYRINTYSSRGYIEYCWACRGRTNFTITIWLEVSPTNILSSG